MRETIVGRDEQCELVTAQSERPLSIELVLLAILRQGQEPVSARDLQREPGPGLWVFGTPSGDEIVIVHVSGDSGEWFYLRSKTIADREVDGVVAMPHIEGTSVGLDVADSGGNQQVRVGIAVAVRVCRQIVLEKKIADLDVLCDGFAVVARHAGREVLGRFYSSGGGL